MRVTLAALLLLYSAAVSAAGTRWLARAVWPLQAPRVGVAAWLTGALSVAASAAAAGLILAIPCVQLTTNLHALQACLSMWRGQYASPAGATAGAAGSVLTVTVLGRLAWFCCSALNAARQRRAIHDDALALIARPGPAPDVAVIDGDQPAAYCVPGRRRIVLTTGALTRLDGRQLDAVLAHERAHLSGRHHVMVMLAVALKDALPPIRFFAVAAQHVTDLVEVAADDAAIRRTPRLTLAAALLAVAAADAPAWALGAGGSAATQRIERLIAPPVRGSIMQRAVTFAALAALAALAITGLAFAAVILLQCPPGVSVLPA
jgi:Zn-dependent protease with chaperone function